MDLLKSANIVLRFLLELCVLAALAFWGATTHFRLATHFTPAADAAVAELADDSFADLRPHPYHW